MAAIATASALRYYASFNDSKANAIRFRTAKTELEFRNSNLTPILAYDISSIRNSSSVCSVRRTRTLNAFKQNREDFRGRRSETVHVIQSWFEYLRDVFPGGSWWSLSVFDRETNGSPIAAKPVTVLQALREMWALVADEKWILFIALSALIVASVSEISMPGLLTASVFSAQNGEMLVFYRNTRLLIFLCFASGLCSGLRSGCFAIANIILVKRLRENVYSSLLVQDISFFDKEAVGDLTSRLSADCQQLSRTIGNDIHLILRNILQGAGAFITLMTLSWPLALSSLVVCFILSAIFLIYGQYQRKAALLAQDFVASANEVAEESLAMMKTIRAYGTEREELQRFTQCLDKLAFVGMRESVAYGFWTLSFNTLYRATQVLAVLLGGMSLLTGHVSAEQLTKYVLYCEWLIYAAWRLQDSMSSLLQSIGACDKVFQLMHLQPSCDFLPRGVKLQSSRGRVEFVDVSFQYPSRKRVRILENVNLSIQANEVFAIVGASGSGKSTLINLLLRLYEPISGEIFVHGVPLREMDIRWLREKIGYVGQEPHLFHMDVKSNISYGCSRGIRHEEIEIAAKKAYAHEFISTLPNGYDTIVDDNLLSGGQKQRIAIARALLRDPIILVLDDATSALDAESEEYVKDIIHSIKTDSKRRTVILIAHKLSTVKAADRILVMKDGRVVEIGSHEDLLRKNGLYTRLFKLQTDAPSIVTDKKEGL